MSHTEDDIREMITENSYFDFEEFQDDTFIGAGCGQCLDKVRKMFDLINK